MDAFDLPDFTFFRRDGVQLKKRRVISTTQDVRDQNL